MPSRKCAVSERARSEWVTGPLAVASGQIATNTRPIEKIFSWLGRSAKPPLRESPEGIARWRRAAPAAGDRRDAGGRQTGAPRLLAQRLRRFPFLLVPEDRAPVPVLGEGHAAFDADPDPLLGWFRLPSEESLEQ